MFIFRLFVFFLLSLLFIRSKTSFSRVIRLLKHIYRAWINLYIRFRLSIVMIYVWTRWCWIQFEKVLSTLQISQLISKSHKSSFLLSSPTIWFLILLVHVRQQQQRHNKSIWIIYLLKGKNNCQVLTFVDSWLDKLITCSRASVNSRFNRRTSFACRCSSVIDPYIDEPPDMSDIWLPWAVVKKFF